MDITPQLLKDIQLSDAFRGYNRDEVDELIERVGGAIVQLQSRLREALERADAAEARVATAGPRSESEETLRRTLVLAQRTADAAISEANAEASATLADANEHAARTISEANERASRLLSDAEQQAALLRSETEVELRHMAEERREPLMDELRQLERTRSFLQDDVAMLERHASEQRARLRSQIAELVRLSEDPALLHVESAPSTSGVEAARPAPSSPPDRTSPPEVSAFAPPPLPPSVSAFLPPPAAIETFGDTADDSGLHADLDEPTIAYEPIDLPAAPAFSASAPSWADDAEQHIDEVVARGESSASSVPEEFASDTSSTPFLDQLRQAVGEDDMDEGAMSEFFDGQIEQSARSRFGRRR